jgi:hypothetical protein
MAKLKWYRYSQEERDKLSIAFAEKSVTHDYFDGVLSDLNDNYEEELKIFQRGTKQLASKTLIIRVVEMPFKELPLKFFVKNAVFQTILKWRLSCGH